MSDLEYFALGVVAGIAGTWFTALMCYAFAAGLGVL